MRQRECRSKEDSEGMQVNVEVKVTEEYDIFHHATKGMISRDWLMFDNKNIMDELVYTNNPQDIHTVDNLKHAFCYARSTSINKKGRF